MAYELHINRRQDDGTGAAIALAEWLGLLRDDPEMRLLARAQATNPAGQDIALAADGLAIWTLDGKERAAFRWSAGEILVGSPDLECRKKMWRLASLLGATVRGDEGELYGPDGAVHAPHGKSAGRVANAGHRPWWRLW